MKSYFNGYGIDKNEKFHMIHVFDGQRVREIHCVVFGKTINWLDREIPGVIEKFMDYPTAKRRLAAYEERATRRIG